jgi:hypothetical protein
LTESRHIPLSQDAALVVALAGTAMPFAHSSEDEAERWLRALRLHGEVGAALQGLGVGEAPLSGDEAARAAAEPDTPPHGPEVLETVARRASDFAHARGGETVSTTDLTYSVLDVYGELFEQTLYLRGTTSQELLERLSGASAAEAPKS